MKFCFEIDHKHAYELCMGHFCMLVTNLTYLILSESVGRSGCHAGYMNAQFLLFSSHGLMLLKESSLKFL